MNDFYAMAIVPMRQRAALSASEYYEQLCQQSERYSGFNFRRMERAKGIEPSSSGWEPEALPLSYTRALTQF